MYGTGSALLICNYFLNITLYISRHKIHTGEGVVNIALSRTFAAVVRSSRNTPERQHVSLTSLYKWLQLLFLGRIFESYNLTNFVCLVFSARWEAVHSWHSSAEWLIIELTCNFVSFRASSPRSAVAQCL